MIQNQWAPRSTSSASSATPGDGESADGHLLVHTEFFSLVQGSVPGVAVANGVEAVHRLVLDDGGFAVLAGYVARLVGADRRCEIPRNGASPHPRLRRCAAAKPRGPSRDDVPAAGFEPLRVQFRRVVEPTAVGLVATSPVTGV